MTQTERTQLAEQSIFNLKDGIANKNKSKINDAYDAIQDSNGFEWDDLDCLFSEWDELLDEANEILVS